MNAPISLRLWKEARALLPMWAIVMAWLIVPHLLGLPHALNYSLVGFIFGCAVLGPAAVGHEFEHRTAILWLSQPRTRRRLWWEKLTVLGVALLALSATMVAVVALNREALRADGPIATETVEFWFVVMLMLPVMGVCTGPALTLIARNTLGGAALTFLCPWALMIGCFLLYPEVMEATYPGDDLGLLTRLFVALCVYSTGLFIHGCWRFQRFEVVNKLAEEFAAPKSFDSMFAWLANYLVPGQASPTAHLLRKELRLQRPAFFVSVFLVTLWLAFIGLWRVHPAVGPEVMMLPSILLGLGIPILAGVVSTAEERHLGVHEMQLTLPVGAHRQWLIKVATAASVNMALGILLPGVLGQASSWLASAPQLLADIPGPLPHFLILNLVLFVATTFASSISANSIRALIGTFVLLLIGGIVMNIAEHIARANWPTSHGSLTDGEGLSVQWGSFHSYRWHLGWIFLAVWSYWLGLAEFRRSLESHWLPVRRMVLFFAVLGVFVFAAIRR